MSRRKKGDFVKKTKEEKAQKQQRRHITYKDKPFLKDIKPKEGYLFFSDYFKIDGKYATVLSYFSNPGVRKGFAPFWGVGLVPKGLDIDVSTINIEHVDLMTEAWVRSKQSVAKEVLNRNKKTQNDSGDIDEAKKADKSAEDIDEIAYELSIGDNYLRVKYRLLIKAPSLEALDEAVEKIKTTYNNEGYSPSIMVGTYAGLQRKQLGNIFQANEVKKGNEFYYTTSEYAGSYSLVTHGLEDRNGEYVGTMVGDYNNAAILFDVDDYDNHVVIANNKNSHITGTNNISDMWASKLSQSALLENKKVVHILLSSCDLDKLGPKFENITSKVDLNKGEINMFELFETDYKDELSAFGSQMVKLRLMINQLLSGEDSISSEEEAQSIFTDFYIGERMWAKNAKENREKLRLLNLDHDEIPTLTDFVAYLNNRYKAVETSGTNDHKKMETVSRLKLNIQNMRDTHGDLFDVTTSSSVDDVVNNPRVIFDFSQIRKRGMNIAMAQLVNVLGYALSNLSNGDVLILHGADLIDKNDEIRDYFNTLVEDLHSRGGRVVYVYDNIEKMLDDHKFNRLDSANYSILGNMTPNVVDMYEDIIGQNIPVALKKNITVQDVNRCYIRRGYDNVVFDQDLRLMPYIEDKKKKRRFIPKISFKKK